MGKKMRSKNPTEMNTSVVVVNRVPPDGGWGWFVVFGSFMIHIVSKCPLKKTNNYNWV